MASRYIVQYHNDEGEVVGSLDYNSPGDVVELIQLLGARNPNGDPVNVKFGGNSYVFSRMETEIDGEMIFVRFAFKTLETWREEKAEEDEQRAALMAQIQGGGGLGGPGAGFDPSALGIPFGSDDE